METLKNILEPIEKLLVAAKFAEHGEIFCYFLHRKGNMVKNYNTKRDKKGEKGRCLAF